MELLPLEGFVVAVTADRRSEEQAELLRRRGAEVIHAPTIETTYLASDRRLRDATAAVIADPPSHLVVTTGIGIRAWFEATQSWGLDGALLEALRAARVIARGPKAAAAAQVVGLSIARTAHDERMHGVREVLMEEQLDGASIAVQCFGDEQVPESEFLAAAGANVVAVPVYRYQMPSDDQPAQLLVEAAIDARVHAVTFTAAPAVRNLFTMAKVRGVQDDLRRSQ